MFNLNVFQLQTIADWSQQLAEYIFTVNKDEKLSEKARKHRIERMFKEQVESNPGALIILIEELGMFTAALCADIPSRENVKESLFSAPKEISEEF